MSGSFVIKASELPRLSSFWSRGPTGMRFSAAAAAAAGSQTVSLRFASAPALTHGRVTHALLNTSGERSRSISSCCDIRLSDLWFLCCSQTSPGLRGTYELLYPRFCFHSQVPIPITLRTHCRAFHTMHTALLTNSGQNCLK